MHTSLTTDKLIYYLSRQIQNSFPDDADLSDLERIVPRALTRTANCFEKTVYANNWQDDKCFFNHLNSDQYIIFLYFCSSVAYFDIKNPIIATKLFFLNKTLNNFHCMYDTILPDVFVIVHGSGIVLGKATYRNYISIMHGCTVGANSKGDTPTIGEYCLMFPNSSITGNSVIGKNSCISNGAFIYNTNISENSLVFGCSPNNIIKTNCSNRLAHVFNLF